MEGESQSEDSSSSPYHFFNNFISIIRNASTNPTLIASLAQMLSNHYPQILSCLDPNKLLNLQKDPNLQQMILQLFSDNGAKKTSIVEIIHLLDEETSASSHCDESDLLDEAKLDILKKNNKKLLKFEEILDKIFCKLNFQNADEIKSICLDVLKLIIPVLTEHFKNKPFEAVAAAVLVFSCRNANYPITLKEIVSASCEQGKDLTKMINKCIFSLKSVLPEKEFSMKILNPDEMAKKIGQKLKLEKEILSCAFQLIKIIENKNLIKGKHPNTVAACAIKIADILLEKNKDGLSFEVLAEASNLNKITLKNTYRDLHIHSIEIIHEIKKVVDISTKELPNL